jgi:predicted metal-dependent peptidase
MAHTYEVTEAVSRLIATQPFYAVLLMDLLTIKETDTIPTAATDGKTLFINPEFFKDKLKNTDERVFVLAHEVLHVIFQHCPRLKMYSERGFGPDLKEWSPMKWNKATDYIINYTLHADGIGSLPTMALYHPDYTGDMIADELYLKMDDEEPPQGNLDEHMAGDESDTPSDGDIKQAIASAAQAAKAMGNVPASMKRMIDELLEPQITWSEKLLMEITAKAGRDSSTWARPNRRRIATPPHLYFPGSTGHQAGHIAMYIDTSGSISDLEVKHFLTEIAAVVQDCTPELVHIGSCDSTAYPPTEVEDIDDILSYKPEGGGGTYMPDIYRVLEEEVLSPDVLVILTDGYTDWDTPPAYPVVVVSTTDKECPYGTTIRLHIAD